MVISNTIFIQLYPVDYSFIKYGTDVFKQSTSFGALDWEYGNIVISHKDVAVSRIDCMRRRQSYVKDTVSSLISGSVFIGLEWLKIRLSATLGIEWFKYNSTLDNS